MDKFYLAHFYNQHNMIKPNENGANYEKIKSCSVLDMARGTSFIGACNTGSIIAVHKQYYTITILNIFLSSDQF